MICIVRNTTIVSGDRFTLRLGLNLHLCGLVIVFLTLLRGIILF
jgi:hypothetical protein